MANQLMRGVAWCVVGALAAMEAQAAWTGGAGLAAAPINNGYLYTDPGNWEDGEMDNSFVGWTYAGTNPGNANDAYVYFGADWTVTNDLNLTHTSGNYQNTLALRGFGDRVLTLEGDIISANTFNATPCIGSGWNGWRLNLDLGNAMHTLWVNSVTPGGYGLRIQDGISGAGGLVKEGNGRVWIAPFTERDGGMTLAPSTFTNLVINQGNVYLAGRTSVGDTATVRVNAGGVVDPSGNTWIDTQRFAFSNGTFFVSMERNTVYNFTLTGDGPIRKAGGTDNVILGSTANDFSHGVFVNDSPLQFDVGTAGQDVKDNDLVAINGGLVFVSGADVLGENQKIIVDTSVPRADRLQGFGATANFALPPFTVQGDGEAVLALEFASAMEDPVIRWAMEHGVYIGSYWNNGRCAATSPLSTDAKGFYRFANYGSANPFFHIDPADVLTGNNSLMLGAPSVQNTGSVNFNSPQDYSGRTVINHGMIVNMNEGGAWTGTSEIRILASPTLPFGYGRATELRLLGRATAHLPADKPIYLGGARWDTQNNYIAGNNSDPILRIAPNAVSDMTVFHEIGPVVLLTGRSGIVQGYWGAANVSGFFLTTEAASLTRMNRSTGYVMQSEKAKETATGINPPIGVWRETAANGLAPAGNRLLLAGGVPSYLVGGDGSRGVNRKIVPFLIGHDFNQNDLGIGYSGGMSSLVTYDATDGFRALRRVADGINAAEFHADIATAQADDNVLVAASVAIGTKAVNSVYVENAVTLTVNAGSTLTVNSGVLCGGNVEGADFDTSVIAFDGREGIFNVTGGNNAPGRITASIADTNGLTVVVGTLGSAQIAGRNAYSGQTTVARGRAIFGRMFMPATFANAEPNVSLPDDGFALVHPGAILQIGHYEGDGGYYCTREII
ncbi:MAG: hypothetical protein FWF84_07480, partial [Kiritimatiellaeota bacterium]|nr:hypothetical protein [Kiritimatiellota bacterium]